MFYGNIAPLTDNQPGQKVTDIHPITNPSFGVARFIRREPLVHFLGLAALLFAANALLSGDAREIITLDVATREFLIEQRQFLLLRDLTDDEKSQAIQDYIDEEILVREARKRGLENNSRIRTLLIQNMRFFIASEIPDPTDEELRAYFDDNIERFESGPSISYEHAFFSDPDTVPADALELLRAGADHRSIGDTNSLTASLARADQKQIVATFGPELAPQILGIDDDQWQGPFTSMHGVHFLRASERHPTARSTYESAAGWLEQEWVMQKRNEILEREMAIMRENYRIEVPGPDKAAD